MQDIPFQKIQWNLIQQEKTEGDTGFSLSQIFELQGLKIRIVEYSNSYLADHWCQKGHIVHCLEGSFITELQSGEKIELCKGETYVVSDNLSSHRLYSETGVKLLIIDGDFLKQLE